MQEHVVPCVWSGLRVHHEEDSSATEGFHLGTKAHHYQVGLSGLFETQQSNCEMCFRSFDVNKPGSEVEELRGGVAGGSILRYRATNFVY